MILRIEIGGAVLDATDTDPPLFVANSVLAAIGVPRNSPLRGLGRFAVVEIPTARGVQRAQAFRWQDLRAFAEAMPPGVLRRDGARKFHATVLGTPDILPAVNRARSTRPAERDGWREMQSIGVRLGELGKRLTHAVAHADQRQAQVVFDALETLMDDARPALARIRRRIAP